MILGAPGRVDVRLGVGGSDGVAAATADLTPGRPADPIDHEPVPDENVPVASWNLNGEAFMLGGR